MIAVTTGESTLGDEAVLVVGEVGAVVVGLVEGEEDPDAGVVVLDALARGEVEATELRIAMKVLQVRGFDG